MGTCATSEKKENCENFKYTLYNFLKNDNYQTNEKSISENISLKLFNPTGNILNNKTSVVVGGLIFTEYIINRVNAMTFDLDLYSTNFTIKLKPDEKWDNNEIENYHKNQLLLFEQLYSSFIPFEFKEIIKYKDECTYLTLSSFSNEISLELNDIDDIINSKNLSDELKDNKSRNIINKVEGRKKSLSVNRRSHMIPFKKNESKIFNDNKIRHSEKFVSSSLRKKSSLHLDRFIKLVNVTKNGRNSVQPSSNPSSNITTNIRNLVNSEDINFSINNTHSSRRNSLSKRTIKDTLSTERNKKNFIKGINEEFDKISEKNESLTIIKTNKKFSVKKKVLNNKNEVKKNMYLKKPILKKLKNVKNTAIVKEKVKVSSNKNISKRKKKNFNQLNFPSKEFSSPRKINNSSEVKKASEQTNKSNDNKNNPTNKFNLYGNENPIMKKNSSSNNNNDINELFSIKPLDINLLNEDPNSYPNENDVVNYENFLKSVTVRKSNKKEYHYIKIDLRKIKKEGESSIINPNIKDIKNSHSSNNLMLKKNTTIPSSNKKKYEKKQILFDSNLNNNEEYFIEATHNLKPYSTRNINNEIKIYNFNYNITNNIDIDNNTRSALKSYNSQSKIPIFPTNRLNLDPLKLDLPHSERLKILKKENKFLFELTEEEKQATDELRTYIDSQCREN